MNSLNIFINKDTETNLNPKWTLMNTEQKIITIITYTVTLSHIPWFPSSRNEYYFLLIITSTNYYNPWWLKTNSLSHTNFNCFNDIGDLLFKTKNNDIISAPNFTLHGFCQEPKTMKTSRWVGSFLFCIHAF